MRVLLDENLPRRLKRHFEEGIETLTVAERGWAGKRNGELLREAAGEFDALITTDQGIPHQQNFTALALGLVLPDARSNRIEDLAPLMPKVNEAPEDSPARTVDPCQCAGSMRSPKTGRYCSLTTCTGRRPL